MYEWKTVNVGASASSGKTLPEQLEAIGVDGWVVLQLLDDYVPGNYLALMRRKAGE